MVHTARRHVPAAALIACLLALAPQASGAATVDLDLDADRISREDGEVVITAEDGREARIGRDGELTIDDRRIRTSARDRRDLRSYDRSLAALESHARELGVQAAGLAASAVGEALAVLLTGDDDRSEEKLETKAASIGEEARALCLEIDELVTLQDRIAASVPAFRPFAVIDSDEDGCELDD